MAPLAGVSVPAEQHIFADPIPGVFRKRQRVRQFGNAESVKRREAGTQNPGRHEHEQAVNEILSQERRGQLWTGFHQQ